MGVVTRNGIVRKGDVTGIRSDYEYGNIALLYGTAEKTILPVLKEVDPDQDPVHNQLRHIEGDTAFAHEIHPLPLREDVPVTHIG